FYFVFCSRQSFCSSLLLCLQKYFMPRKQIMKTRKYHINFFNRKGRKIFYKTTELQRGLISLIGRRNGVNGMRSADVFIKAKDIFTSISCKQLVVAGFDHCRNVITRMSCSQILGNQ